MQSSANSRMLECTPAWRSLLKRRDRSNPCTDLLMDPADKLGYDRALTANHYPLGSIVNGGEDVVKTVSVHAIAMTFLK